MFRWGEGAIGTAHWTGVSLKKVLKHCGGRKEGAGHLEFMGVDTYFKKGQVYNYVVSVPWRKVRIHEVMLAWEMNGKPLPKISGVWVYCKVRCPGRCCIHPCRRLNRSQIQKCQVARTYNRDPGPFHCPCSEERVSLLHTPSRQAQRLIEFRVLHRRYTRLLRHYLPRRQSRHHP